jgi:hypothetical protein
MQTGNPKKAAKVLDGIVAREDLKAVGIDPGEK